MHGAWSRGREAVVVLPLDAPHDGPLTVTLEVAPFLAHTRPHLEVAVAIDGTPAARWGFSGTGGVAEQRVVAVPARAGRERIALRFADPPSALAAGGALRQRPAPARLRAAGPGADLGLSGWSSSARIL